MSDLKWEEFTAEDRARTQEPPTSWKLVPYEPTREMVQACKPKWMPRIALPFFVAAYKTMLDHVQPPRATATSSPKYRDLRLELINSGALRQLRHNDGSEDIVFAYDQVSTDRFLASLGLITAKETEDNLASVRTGLQQALTAAREAKK